MEDRTLLSTTLWFFRQQTSTNTNWNNVLNWATWDGQQFVAANVVPLTNAYDVAFRVTNTVTVNCSPTVAAMYFEGESDTTFVFDNTSGTNHNITVTADPNAPYGDGSIKMHMTPTHTTAWTTSVKDGVGASTIEVAAGGLSVDGDDGTACNMSFGAHTKLNLSGDFKTDKFKFALAVEGEVDADNMLLPGKNTGDASTASIGGTLTLVHGLQLGTPGYVNATLSGHVHADTLAVGAGSKVRESVGGAGAGKGDRDVFRAEI